MNPKLRIFTNERYRPTDAPHVELLYPFWGMVEEKAFWKFDDRFGRYLERGPEIFELVADPSEAEVHLLPADWGYYLLTGETDKAKEMSELAGKYGKSLLIFFRDDRECKTGLTNTIELCTNLERSRRRSNQRGLVAWTGDFVAAYLNGSQPIRRKGPKPVVSFCGQSLSHTSMWAKGRSMLGALRHPLLAQRSRFLTMREKVLRSLERSDRVETNIVRRDGWYGGKERAQAGEDQGRVKKIRREFVRNLVESDYVVSVRGAGNYSFRFYESLACGRVPLFIDTDCVLPFENRLNWKEYCVWLDYKNIKYAGEAVADFHHEISDKRFVELQHECRRIFKEWVSPEGFFSKLSHTL